MLPLKCYLQHVRGKLWPKEPWCSLLVGDNTLTSDQVERGLTGVMGGMTRKFTTVFDLMGPGDKE